LIASLSVNPAAKPALMDVRAARQEKKRRSPAGATPPFYFLASGPLSCGRTSQAGNEAGRTEKGNKTMTNTKTETKKAPVSKVRIGLISASIWENPTEKGTFYNVTFERRYRDGAGKWQSTHSYGLDDLLTLAKVADQAHSKIVEAFAGDKE